MGTIFSIILDILAILAIIVFGAFIVVVIADLILCMFDDHEGIIFRRHKEEIKKETKIEEKSTVEKDDIVVYSNQVNPNGNVGNVKTEKKQETINGEVVTEIDFNKAVEEQQALARKKNIQEPVSAPEPKPVQTESKKEQKQDEFWDVDEDQEFKDLLDEVVFEAKNAGKKQKEVVKEESKKEEPKKDETSEETKQALDELKQLKAEQQKEIEELKQLKEDFAREKEEQLALLKENLDKAKAEEIEKIRKEAILEQEKAEAEKARLEEEKRQLEEERAQLKEELKNTTEVVEQEPIIKETIIKDEEEINKLKYKNLMRMNSRLTRIIKDTERLQIQKERAVEKQRLEKQKLLEKEQEERIKEQERRIEIQKQNHDKLVKQSEALKKKNEINRKLQEVSKKAGKYKLDTPKVRVAVEKPVNTHHVVEETVTTVEETIPGTDIVVKTIEKEPIKATAKPIFEKEYYEQKLIELDAELRETEKELRANKTEYIPLTRIHKAYERDSEKLRKKEIQIAKQKVALYGVNSSKTDPVKKAKLDENLAAYAELKDSVSHCEEVIKKNKDRYPVLQKNYELIVRHVDRINADIKTCEKAISYYNKKK